MGGKPKRNHLAGVPVETNADLLLVVLLWKTFFSGEFEAYSLHKPEQRKTMTNHELTCVNGDVAPHIETASAVLFGFRLKPTASSISRPLRPEVRLGELPLQEGFYT